MNLFESKRLREERAGIVSEMQALGAKIREEKRTFTAEEKEQMDRLGAEEQRLRDEIDTCERLEAIPQVEERKEERKLFLPQSRVITAQDRDFAFRAWALKAAGQEKHIRSEFQHAADKVGLNLNSNEYTAQLENREGLLVGTDASGGYTANDAIVRGLEVALKAYGGVLNVAQVITTTDGNPIKWATVDDSSTVATIIGENVDMTADNPTFSTVELGAYTYRSGIYPVSLELLQDSNVPIAQFIGEALGTRIARAVNADITTGAGSAGPKGVVTCSTEGVNLDASRAEVEYEDLLALYHSVDPAYRGNASWMFNDTQLSELQQLVDSDGRPLWQVSLSVGEPDKLLGKPFTINQAMSDFVDGGSSKIMLFGDFKKFIVRRVRDVNLLVLRERYATQLAVAFVAFARFDSDCINTAAIKHMVM